MNTIQTPVKPSSISFWIKDLDEFRLVSEVPRSRSGALIRQMRAAGEPRPHPNAKAVQVVAVDEAKVGQWPEIEVETLRPGATFESAFAASLHLGFDHNEVGQRLGKARRLARLKSTEQPDELPIVVVRGVSLQYLEGNQSGI